MVQVSSLVNWMGYNRQEPPDLLYGDHSSMQLSPVEMADALGSFVRCRHGDKSVAPSSGTAGVGHHFGPDNLREKGHSHFPIKITTRLAKTD